MGRMLFTIDGDIESESQDKTAISMETQGRDGGWEYPKADLRKDERRGKITAKFLLKLIESQGYQCALTGRKLEPETAVLDHKHPQAEGGDHERENVWWVHRDVNSAKGTMSVEDFILLCQDVANYSERRQ